MPVLYIWISLMAPWGTGSACIAPANDTESSTLLLTQQSSSLSPRKLDGMGSRNVKCLKGTQTSQGYSGNTRLALCRRFLATSYQYVTIDKYVKVIGL